ncbi:MAG: tRNA (adenosine(37)-N6)-dimethylallyltransferase MiaA [Patescibacteria group bacterium]|jgi:tRNA dimethylallyltransferase
MVISKQGKAIVIVGPTSSGKTDLSLQLAKKFNGVVISADSRQIYKDMDIATAKTTRDQQQNITHYMIDILSPDEDFNLAHYQNTVNNLLCSISENNSKRSQPVIPFIVGGTGLYIKSIVDGYQLPAVPPNPVLRAQLEQFSIKELAHQLKQLDPTTKVDLQNKRRVIRALEIIKNRSGKPILNQPVKLNYEFFHIGITRPRPEIKQRIVNKITEMYKQGLVKETKKLLAKGYDFTKPAFSALGYKHILGYLQHKITLHEALDRMRQDTQRYAKRQMTWFKRDPRIHWIKDYTEAETLIRNFLR